MINDLIKTDTVGARIERLVNIRGQPQVTNVLTTHVRAHINMLSTNGGLDFPFGPVLMSGPPGTGKTQLARRLHDALENTRLVEVNGVAINDVKELYAILVCAEDKTTLFIDEGHAAKTKAQDILLTAFSERRLHIPARKPAAHYHTIPLANFTGIVATTDEYQLCEALRSRMRIICRFNYYSADNLIEIIRERADTLGWKYESDEVLRVIAERAKGTPRQALDKHLHTCWYVAMSHDRGIITMADAIEAFRLLGIDEIGLEQIDRRYLGVLAENGPTPLNVFSSKLGLPGRTIQSVLEPYLLREGLFTKNRGSIRMLTPKGRNHLETTVWPV